MPTAERVLVSALIRIQLAELLAATDFPANRSTRHVAMRTQNNYEILFHCNSKAAKIITLLEINNQACKISP